MNKKIVLLGLLLLAIARRIPYVIDATIPFMFDHARDALAVMHMIDFSALKFIGPKTSITGLFFGPAWYYLLAPAYFLGGGNPVAPVILMILLSLLQLYLINRYFNSLAALAIAVTPIWVWISTSAWNPFPITLTSLIILIVLKQTSFSQKLSNFQAFLLGINAGLGFHFSSAFAIFYPPLIIISLIWQKTKVKTRKCLWGITAFLLPFIPQALFEIKHNFLELRAVANYLHSGTGLEVSSLKTGEMLKSIGQNLLGASLPIIGNVPPWLQSLIVIIIATFIFVTILRKAHNKKVSHIPLIRETVLFMVLPAFGFIWLHYNSWYMLGMIPAATILISYLINTLPLEIKKVIIALYLLCGFGGLINYYAQEKNALLHDKNFLPQKLAAIQTIRDKAGNEPFASYHYLPDVYDYAYQYLYFWQATKGLVLPTDFAYRPNETSYIPEKNDLLKKFQTTQSVKPKLIFFLAEKPIRAELLNQWWSEQTPHSIINKWQINPELTLYQAVPL